MPPKERPVTELDCDEACLEVLPPDAPEGHSSFKAVKAGKDPLGNPRASFSAPTTKERLQTTKKACGNSLYLMERVARACYIKFEEGLTKEAVLKWRDELYEKLRQINPDTAVQERSRKQMGSSAKAKAGRKRERDAGSPEKRVKEKEQRKEKKEKNEKKEREKEKKARKRALDDGTPLHRDASQSASSALSAVQPTQGHRGQKRAEPEVEDDDGSDSSSSSSSSESRSSVAVATRAKVAASPRWHRVAAKASVRVGFRCHCHFARVCPQLDLARASVKMAAPQRW
mmetsp:Transcript_17357/g.40474  ORF Transcript_17357/g.40474 Transcript_17357/m.40474 type:complete len:286 (+) Transcript_17357:100-957(+)